MRCFFNAALQSNFRIVSTAKATGEQPGWINIGETRTGQQRTKLSPDKLAMNWSCTLETAQLTLDVTTQRGIRNVANPIPSRRFGTNT